MDLKRVLVIVIAGAALAGCGGSSSGQSDTGANDGLPKTTGGSLPGPVESPGELTTTTPAPHKTLHGKGPLQPPAPAQPQTLKPTTTSP